MGDKNSSEIVLYQAKEESLLGWHYQMGVPHPSEISSCTEDTNVMESLRLHILNEDHKMMCNVMSELATGCKF